LSSNRFHWKAIGKTLVGDYAEADHALKRAITLGGGNEPDNYTLGMCISGLWHGDKEEMREVLKKGINAGANPYEIISSNVGTNTMVGFWRFDLLSEPYEEQITGLHDYFEASPDGSDDYLLYASVGQIYDLKGESELAQSYYDTTRTQIEKLLDVTSDDFGTHKDLGLILALLGDYEGAVKEGEIARGLMSVEDCHW